MVELDVEGTVSTLLFLDAFVDLFGDGDHLLAELALSFVEGLGFVFKLGVSAHVLLVLSVSTLEVFAFAK